MLLIDCEERKMKNLRPRIHCRDQIKSYPGENQTPLEGTRGVLHKRSQQRVLLALGSLSRRPALKKEWPLPCGEASRGTAMPIRKGSKELNCY